LWELDSSPDGFKWIDVNNCNQSVIIFTRWSYDSKDVLIVVCNFTPVVYYDYRIGVPFKGIYKEIFNTDNIDFGGSGQVMEEILFSEEKVWQNEKQSLLIKVPPMATLILKPENINKI